MPIMLAVKNLASPDYPSKVTVLTFLGTCSFWKAQMGRCVCKCQLCDFFSLFLLQRLLFAYVVTWNSLICQYCIWHYWPCCWALWKLPCKFHTEAFFCPDRNSATTWIASTTAWRTFSPSWMPSPSTLSPRLSSMWVSISQISHSAQLLWSIINILMILITTTDLGLHYISPYAK